MKSTIIKKKVNENILKKYIHSIIKESHDLQKLEDLYLDDIIEKNSYNQYKNGWDELNSLIKILNEYDLSYGSDELDIKINEIQKTLKTLNFKLIGEGQSREVYTKDDINFIIKIAKQNNSIYDDYDSNDSYEEYIKNPISYLKEKSKFEVSESNELEIKTYENYGKHFPKQDMFTKIYAYDYIDYTWIISEKVYIFNSTAEIESIFTPLFTQIKEIKKIITHDQSLINDNIFKQFLNLNENNFTHEFLLECIIQLCIQLSEQYLEKDEQTLFIDLIVNNIIIRYFDAESNYNAKQYIKNKLKSTLKKYNIQPTQDIIYIQNFLKNGKISDLQYHNLGYRKSDINKKQPWKNFVILDIGEGLE